MTMDIPGCGWLRLSVWTWYFMSSCLVRNNSCSSCTACIYMGEQGKGGRGGKGRIEKEVCTSEENTGREKENPLAAYRARNGRS